MIANQQTQHQIATISRCANGRFNPEYQEYHNNHNNNNLQQQQQQQYEAQIKYSGSEVTDDDNAKTKATAAFGTTLTSPTEVSGFASSVTAPLSPSVSVANANSANIYNYYYQQQHHTSQVHVIFIQNI